MIKKNNTKSTVRLHIFLSYYVYVSLFKRQNMIKEVNILIICCNHNQINNKNISFVFLSE